MHGVENRHIGTPDNSGRIASQKISIRGLRVEVGKGSNIRGLDPGTNGVAALIDEETTATSTGTTEDVGVYITSPVARRRAGRAGKRGPDEQGTTAAAGFALSIPGTSRTGA